MDSSDIFTCVLQGCFTGTGTVIPLWQSQLSNPEWYGEIGSPQNSTKCKQWTYFLVYMYSMHWETVSHLIQILTYHLRHIYTTSEISVRASESELGRNWNNWIDVSCLHWSKSVSETFASDLRIRARRYMQRFPRTRTSEFVRGCAVRMLKAACSRGRYCRLPKMTIASGDLGSEPPM